MPDSKPPHKPLPRQPSHSPEQIVAAQQVVAEALAEHISGEHALPADYEQQTDDTPAPDRREAELPRRMVDMVNANVPARWLGMLIVALLSIAGTLVGVGIVWGQTVVENRTGIAEAKADAAEAKLKATPVAKLEAKLDATKEKTDATAVKVDSLTSETAAARQDIAVVKTQQTALTNQINDMAADIKVLVKAAATKK